MLFQRFFSISRSFSTVKAQNGHLKLSVYVKYGFIGSFLSSLLFIAIFVVQGFGSSIEYGQPAQNVYHVLFRQIEALAWFFLFYFYVWYGMSVVLVLFLILLGERKKIGHSKVHLTIAVFMNLLSILPLSLLYAILCASAAIYLSALSVID